MARHPIHEYFRPAQQDSPMTWKPFPDNPEAQIMGWLQHENYSACYIPIIDNAPVFKFFYCSTCRAWKRISTSTGHIRIHYDSVSHSDERFLEKNQMTPDMASRMMKATTFFLLTNGLPFRLIDDQYFQVLPTLGHRRKLKEVSRKMARSVLNSIKQTLARVSYCSLSVDEWADVTRQRYIGVSCHTRLEGIMRVFTIAHYSVATAIGPDGRDHLNAKDVATIVHEVMKDFQICKKTLLIVTDRASIMQNALTLLTDMRLEDGLVPVLGAPCVCHVVNSLLSKFVKLVSPAVQDVIDIQNKLSHSEVFANKLLREEHEITRIPGYCPVRWYSLFEMLKAMKRLKEPILSFYQIELLQHIPTSVWTTIDELLPLTDVVKSATKALEGERYSTICFVLQAFQRIHDKAMELPQVNVSYEEPIKAWNEYYQKTVQACRHQWYPLLEVACFLHPGINHSKFLTSSDRLEIANYLEKNHAWTDLTMMPAIDRALHENATTPTRTTAVYRARTDEVRRNPTPLVEAVQKGASHDKDALRSLMDNEKGTAQVHRTQTIKDEMNAYITMLRPGLMPEDFWNHHEDDLPRLSTIARRLMAIIPSSAATESSVVQGALN